LWDLEGVAGLRLGGAPFLLHEAAKGRREAARVELAADGNVAFGGEELLAASQSPSTRGKLDFEGFRGPEIDVLLTRGRPLPGRAERAARSRGTGQGRARALA
jgi:hypothetical protein